MKLFIADFSANVLRRQLILGRLVFYLTLCLLHTGRIYYKRYSRGIVRFSESSSFLIISVLLNFQKFSL